MPAPEHRPGKLPLRSRSPSATRISSRYRSNSVTGSADVPHLRQRGAPRRSVLGLADDAQRLVEAVGPPLAAAGQDEVGAQVVQAGERGERPVAVAGERGDPGAGRAGQDVERGERGRTHRSSAIATVSSGAERGGRLTSRGRCGGRALEPAGGGGGGGG